jgi:hypothetical protein
MLLTLKDTQSAKEFAPLRSRRMGAMATWSCTGRCAPPRTPPAAPSAGSRPLSPTFSPTRIPEDPEIKYLRVTVIGETR